MGLLSRINNSSAAAVKTDIPVKPASETGLLARAAQSSKSITYSSFQEWAKSKGFSHCGVFTLVHGMMVITQSYGLDSQTIANSVSSRDFWKGTLSSKAVLNYSKNDNELYNFLQFFSFELKSSIYHISFLKFNNNSDFSVLMVYNTEAEKEINLSEVTASSLKYGSNFNIDSSKLNKDFQPYYLYSITFESLVNNAIKSIQLPEANITNAAVKCINEEIYDLIKSAFPAPNLVSLGHNGKVNLALTSKILDESLMQYHINLLLKETLNNPSQLPFINNFGTEDNFENLIKFLEK